MIIQTISSIIAMIVAIISIIISLKSYLIEKPKIKISITDKENDVYYGKVALDNNSNCKTKVGAVKFNIINNSSVEIYIKEVVLKIKKDYHPLIDKRNSVWKNIYFYYLDDNNEEMWDGIGINYKSDGMSIPCYIKPYTIKSGLCLFNYFPNVDKKSVKGTLIIKTAIGTIKRKVKFKSYDKDYYGKEFKDIDLFRRNYID